MPKNDAIEIQVPTGGEAEAGRAVMKALKNAPVPAVTFAVSDKGDLIASFGGKQYRVLIDPVK